LGEAAINFCKSGKRPPLRAQGSKSKSTSTDPVELIDSEI